MSSICPLCCRTECSSTVVNDNYTRFECSTYGRTFYFGKTITECQDDNRKRELENLVFEHITISPMCDDQHWRYYYEELYKSQENDERQYVNLAEIPYPSSFSDKVDRILLNLHRLYPSYLQTISSSDSLGRALFPETVEEEQYRGILLIMVELGYLNRPTPTSFSISAGGWKHIEDLNRAGKVYKQGFIAMSFCDETKEISEAFKRAITECGYLPIRMDEKEHNNQIVPELLYEIDKSSFLVMDATKANLGAYYEAGYAMGKGKEVIICCRKEVFDSQERPHFDILQKSIVIWESHEELIERLKRRIEATVR